MDRTIAIEIVYRGIFQKNLAKNISRGIVLAARREGKWGISFGRYGDSPERNGIPAKSFAIVAPTQEELEESMARYEPTAVDVSIVVDDTLCKGVESWAWYGLQPINKLVKPGATLLVTSIQPPEELLKDIHQKETEYNLAMVKGIASFSGLWVYKDDHTDVRILGALARICPQLYNIGSVQQAIIDEWGDPLKATSAEVSFARVEMRKVLPQEGNPEKPFSFQLLKWWEMREGVVIPAIKMGEAMKDPETGKTGGYRPARNATFKKFSTRSMRPVIDFDTCIKCTLCWLQCPDSCFDVTADGLYDANMEACCGCGVCEAVCPVEKCVTMVNEQHFNDNASQWEMWKKDKAGYKQWVDELLARVPEKRMHGFQIRGQYQQEIKELAKLGLAGGREEVSTEEVVDHGAG
ncbi:MAG: (4Fe-4S)-binding protein [Armatimonadetes bacterium]|nr:(4Fe-4S)-binding protein [Armatimonadota bacterium]